MTPLQSSTSQARRSGIRIRAAWLLHRLAYMIEPTPFLDKRKGKSASAFDLFTRFFKKLFRRMLIWLVSLAVAFYVPFAEAGLPLHYTLWKDNITAAHKFSDVFLATVAMVVLSASDLIDNIIARRSNTGIINVASAWALMAIYFLFVLYGMPAYSSSTTLAAQGYLPYDVLFLLLGVGVVGEILIATVAD